MLRAGGQKQDQTYDTNDADDGTHDEDSVCGVFDSWISRHTYVCVALSVIPTKVGIHSFFSTSWIPSGFPRVRE